MQKDKDIRQTVKITNPKVHKKLKIYCAKEGLTFTEAISKLLNEKK